MRRRASRVALAGALLLGLPSSVRGQTLLDPQLQLEEIITAVQGEPLAFATNIAFLGSDDILVLEKRTGRVRRVVTGTLQSEPVLDVAVNRESERGLLGIAINTEDPPGVFLYYTEASVEDGPPLGNRVYRYDWNPTAQQLENPQIVLDLPVLPGPNHDGGIVLLGPPGEAPGAGDGSLLYVVIGDLNRDGQLENFPDGDPPDDTAVVLRVQQDGSPAPDNPFTPYCSITTSQTCPGGTGCPGGESCITEVARYFAYGVRNSFGLALDPVTGVLWETENGPATYDEVNRVAPGFNSGWEQIMGPDLRDPQGVGDLFEMPGAGPTYSDPEFSWLDTTAPTSIVFPFGSNLGAVYDEMAIVGDANSGQLFGFLLNPSRTAFDFADFPLLVDLVAENNAERDLLSIGTGFGTVTDLEIGPDGALYVVSGFGFNEAQIYRISGPGLAPVPLAPPAGLLLLALLLVAALAAAAHTRRGALERETGLEPATPSLGGRRKPSK